MSPCLTMFGLNDISRFSRFPSISPIGAGKHPYPSIQPIDNYRLTSLEEPTDEMLAQLMREAAEEAKQKKEEATARFFSQLKRDAEKIAATW